MKLFEVTTENGTFDLPAEDLEEAIVITEDKFGLVFRARSEVHGTDGLGNLIIEKGYHLGVNGDYE